MTHGLPRERGKKLLRSTVFREARTLSRSDIITRMSWFGMMGRRFAGWCGIWLCALLALLPACAEKGVPRPTAAWQESLVNERVEKDLAFRSGSASPLPENERGQFRGLDYYPVEPSLRFRVWLNRYPSPREVRIGTNTGEVRSGLRYGYFEFEVDGRACRLQVYRMNEDEAGRGPTLFIPFRDATTGEETYAAGRYLELPENTTGMYDLDFNRAYNPFCAYGKNFSCPVPPAENTLPVAIRAGEKAYRGSS
jgi:uncharacterized protein (DUF1684 family)